MTNNTTWIEHAKYLMAEGGSLPSLATDLGCGYEMDNGVLVVDLDDYHYPTYYLTSNDGELSVIYKQLDDYEKHEKAIHTEYAMDDELWDELTESLDALVNEIKSYKKLKSTNLKPFVENLLNALYDDPRLGERPASDTLADYTAGAIIGLLSNHNRVAGWEWREWGNQCFLLAELPALQSISKLNVSPSEDEITESFQDDLVEYSLNWLDKQLKLHGFTTITLGLMDEYQDFCLISVSSVKALKKTLKKLGIKYKLATTYA